MFFSVVKKKAFTDFSVSYEKRVLLHVLMTCGSRIFSSLDHKRSSTVAEHALLC